MPDFATARCRIFPPIGIARLGNSPTEHFIGPEAPGVVPDAGGSFKDPSGRIKRQGARFRVYAFFADGSVEEFNAEHRDVRTIEWSVSLANKKASWYAFDGSRHVAKMLRSGGGPLRNPEVVGQDRDALDIVAPAATVSGRSHPPVSLKGHVGFARRAERDVLLGDARTDPLGRLVVLGGFGKSETLASLNPLTHYANNNGWYDDTSDGPVAATIHLKDGRRLTVEGGAWVVCAPPHFSPWSRNVVTLYDAMAEAAVRHGLAWPERELGPAPSDDVSFVRDIYPALEAMRNYQWVSRRSQRGHASGKSAAFPSAQQMVDLASPAEAKKEGSLAKRFASRLRRPVATPPYEDVAAPQRWPVLSPHSLEARSEATLYYMPPLSGDEGDVDHEKPETWLTLTPMQRAKFCRWQEGNFDGDWTGVVAWPSLDQIPVNEQPAALTRAALEATQGGAFFPGIELTSIVRHREMYAEAFRVAHTLSAGDLTKWMALPWQADFNECRDNWWPAARPDDVVPVGSYERILEEFANEVGSDDLADLLIARRRWDRGVGIEAVAKPEFPAISGMQTPLDYKVAFEVVLERYIVAYLGFLPSQLKGESDESFQLRVLEFLDRTILSKPGFRLPHRAPGASDKEYEGAIAAAVRGYIEGGVAVRAPNRGETVEAYGAALLKEFGAHEIVNGIRHVVWRQARAHRGKNEMVAKWSRLGFVTPRSSHGQTVYVEADRDRFDLLEWREHFYYLMNVESHPEYLPRARALGSEYFRRAREEEAKLDATSTYKFFRYDPVTFEARLEKIYEYERRSGEAFDPVLAPGPENIFASPERIVQRIRQLAPFNQLDGSWLERITKSGPIDDVQSALFEIWSDEIGNGDPAQNHANVYTDLMRSAGIYLPPLNSHAYAHHPDLWPSSYCSPAYQAAAALFPETFYPELLGMTLYLEWEAIFLKAMVKLYDYFGYSSLFYRLHVAIDNPVQGHGARARDADVRYLNDVRQRAGESEAQEHWRRIWDGYLAFKFVAEDEWEYRFANPPSIDERMIEMIVSKRHFGQLNHGRKLFAGNALNDWFDEPKQFLAALASSDLIVPGDAARSPMFEALSPTGVMLKVFTPAEKQLWADWVDSLPKGAPGGFLAPGDAMRVLLVQLRARGMGVPSHSGYQLQGSYVDPVTHTTVNVEQSIVWWFSTAPLESFMAALGDPKNGFVVPGSPERSRLVREFLSGSTRMGRFMARPVPELGGRTARDVVLDWIRTNCTPPSASAPSALAARLRSIAGRQERAGPSGDRDEFAPEVIGQTLSAHRFSADERAALGHRRQGPCAGAVH